LAGSTPAKIPKLNRHLVFGVKLNRNTTPIPRFFISPLFVHIEQNLKRKQCDFSSNEPVTRNPVRNESPCCCDFQKSMATRFVGAF
jgi:hypothetical protein